MVLRLATLGLRLMQVDGEDVARHRHRGLRHDPAYRPAVVAAMRGDVSERLLSRHASKGSALIGVRTRLKCSAFALRTRRRPGIRDPERTPRWTATRGDYCGLS